MYKLLYKNLFLLLSSLFENCLQNWSHISSIWYWCKEGGGVMRRGSVSKKERLAIDVVEFLASEKVSKETFLKKCSSSWKSLSFMNKCQIRSPGWFFMLFLKEIIRRSKNPVCAELIFIGYLNPVELTIRRMNISRRSSLVQRQS